MKLITEQVEKSEFIVEEKIPGQKEYFITGIFMQGNKQNRNGRIYPMEVLDREVKRYSDTYITSNRAFGELGHPDGPTINLDRVSHMIKELYRDGDNYVGKAKIMDTPMGKIVKNLIDEGAQLGVSSRGMGSLKQSRGINVVQDDFYLATAADIVADPSAPDAFVAGIMEGKEWIWDNGVLRESTIGEYRKQIESASKTNLEEVKMRLFSDFIQRL
jgi:hypothetical protein